MPRAPKDTEWTRNMLAGFSPRKVTSEYLDESVKVAKEKAGRSGLTLKEQEKANTDLDIARYKQHHRSL
jgi:hypothetical protein